MPTISTLVVDVKANTSKFSTALKGAGLAVAAIGVAAVKTALDYDNAFTKIAAVSNASAADIEKWRGAVLSLAGDTAQAPKELADALFFLASAGLKTDQIMPVLEASAKAAASGLGEVQDVAKLTANVLNAYAGSGIKAADVTDTLVAAVREGSADTDEFGTALGRILPIASAAGVSFGSVSASLSSLSNIGLDVNEGVTAMRGLLQALVSPTVAAGDALETVGLSSQDLLDSLQGQGLIATLRLLSTAVQKTSGTQAEYLGTLRAIVPNTRSLTGLLGLTTQQASRVDRIFKKVTNSTGSLDKAFTETSDSAGFKFKQALSELSVVAIRLGDLLLPALVAVVEYVRTNVGPVLEATSDWFRDVWVEIGPLVKRLYPELTSAVKSVWATLSKQLFPALRDAYKAVQPLLKSLAPLAAAFLFLALKVLPVLIRIQTTVLTVWLRMIQVAGTVATGILSAFGKVLDFFRHLPSNLKAAGAHMWDWMVDAFKGAINAVIGLWNGLSFPGFSHTFDPLGRFGPAQTISIPGFDLPDIPTLAKGGIVLGTGLALVHEGEQFSGVRARPRRGEKMTVRLDRRRFLDELAYDATFGNDF